MFAEKFEELPSEKKMRIINAGLECFGQYGYKKANTDLIVEKAGISKGLLFYYFKNKETFYLYLCDFCCKVSLEAVDVVEMSAITDFFDMLDFGIKTKLKVWSDYPYIKMKKFRLRLMIISLKILMPHSMNISRTLTFHDSKRTLIRSTFTKCFHGYPRGIYLKDIEPINRLCLRKLLRNLKNGKQ